VPPATPDVARVAAISDEPATPAVLPASSGEAEVRSASSPSAPGAGLGERAASRQVEMDRIAELLKRFQLAYQQLDANAATALWPTVNKRALARAFDGLKSQNLELNRCDLSVNGVAGEAECRGTTTYVPRVGSQYARTESRQWTFQLRKNGSGWVITSAETR
jgi:hypothetical protein